MSSIDTSFYIGPLLSVDQVRTLTEYLTDAHPSGDRLKIAQDADDGVIVQNESGSHVIAPDGSVRS